MSSQEQGTELFSLGEVSNTTLHSIGDERPAMEKSEKFVAFFLGNSIYCVSSKAVAEVVHPLPVSPLPTAPWSIKGIAAIRGEVVAVTNIRKILGLEDSLPNGKAKLIILRSNAKNTQFAIPVDSMHELISVVPEAVTSDPSSMPDGITRLVKHESDVFKIIDVGVLLERVEASIG